MISFKVLKHNQSLMSRLGIYSYRLNEPTNEFFKSITGLYMLFIVIAFYLASGSCFIYKNLAQLRMALEGLLLVIAGLQCGGMFFNIGLEMKTVKALHIKLQAIVDEVFSSK